MAIPDNKIFLGHTPVDQRKYITAVLKHLVKTHPKIIIPAVGQFTLVKCAIAAGYEKQNIYTSDISLFTSLLGYHFSGRSVDELDFEIVNDEYRAEYTLCQSDGEKIAYILWLMKTAQMSKIHYKSKTLNFPVIWYRFRSVEGFNEAEVIYAKEYEIEKQDYWLITKPEVIQDFPHYKHIAGFKPKNLRPYTLPLFSDSDTIDENTTVRFVSVSEDVALYYRDLFAHRLGNTGAEHHYLMLVGEKVFSCVGFTTSKLFRLQTNYIFENYGFSVPSKKYPRNNRLLMMMITSEEMGRVIRNTTSNKNRFYSLEGMKTTCLSKWRSIKTHQGILERTHREQMPNGMYKIQASTKWHDRDFKKTLALWLEEQRTGAKVLTSETFNNSLE